MFHGKHGTARPRGWSGRSVRGAGSRLAESLPDLGGQDPDDAVEVLDAGEVDAQPSLVAAKGHADAGVETVAESGREVVELARPAAGARAPAHRLGGTVAERHHLLDGADRQPLGDDAPGEPLHALAVLEPQPRPPAHGGQTAAPPPPLDGRRQLEKSERVADLRPAAADPRRQLLVGAAEVVEQLLVGS